MAYMYGDNCLVLTDTMQHQQLKHDLYITNIIWYSLGTWHVKSSGCRRFLYILKQPDVVQLQFTTTTYLNHELIVCKRFVAKKKPETLSKWGPAVIAKSFVQQEQCYDILHL